MGHLFPFIMLFINTPFSSPLQHADSEKFAFMVSNRIQMFSTDVFIFFFSSFIYFFDYLSLRIQAVMENCKLFHLLASECQACVGSPSDCVLIILWFPSDHPGEVTSPDVPGHAVESLTTWSRGDLRGNSCHLYSKNQNAGAAWDPAF